MSVELGGSDNEEDAVAAKRAEPKDVQNKREYEILAVTIRRLSSSLFVGFFFVLATKTKTAIKRKAQNEPDSDNHVVKKIAVLESNFIFTIITQTMYI